MKNFSIFLLGLSLVMYGNTTYSVSRSDNPQNLPAVQSDTETIHVSSSTEMYGLTASWVNEYNRLNPAAKIAIDKNGDSKLQTGDHLKFVVDSNEPGSEIASPWKMVIARDVIVPIVSSRNPMLGEINQQGISANEFALLFSNTEKRNWAAVLKNGQNISFQLYIPKNEEFKSCLQHFSNKNIDPDQVKLLNSTSDVFEALQKDYLAIGFCKLSDLKRANLVSENCKLLPIDKNGNGRIDSFEQIYQNLDEFTHGVWIGKYPHALSKSIVAVSQAKPTDENEVAFLSWILADGQNLLNSNGYCDLTNGEKQASLASLINIKNFDIQEINTASTPSSWPIFLTIVLLVGLFITIYSVSKSSVKMMSPVNEISSAPILNENTIDIPKGIYFDKTHTWAFMEQDGNVRVGIDDFLQHVTGKLTNIRMKEAGESVRKGEAILTVIRDGKQLNIYSPISGTIVDHNESLVTDTTIVNSSPFFKGWVYQIEPKNWLREVQFMFLGQKYVDWLQDEFIRLKDFIAHSANSDKLSYAHVVLQDGGELIDNVLADLGPEVWEDFQTKFIDTSR
jgi:glycine cleavage system H lipoate-binding protein/ABC-type phosphate transport system substrate-binding protein